MAVLTIGVALLMPAVASQLAAICASAVHSGWG